MDARSLAGDLQAPLGMVLGVDQEVAETVGKRHEVAFGVDNGLLHPRGTLFQQPTQQVGFAGARIALHQQAGRQSFGIHAEAPLFLSTVSFFAFPLVVVE